MTEVKKAIKPKIERVTPAHIVECWRMIDRSMKDDKHAHPDCTEDQPEVIRAHIFQTMCSSEFFGLVMKIGRKPVGQILCQFVGRPYGRPSKFALIWSAWVEPEYRKRGYMGTLYKDLFARLKDMGIHHWESDLPEDIADQVMKYQKLEAKKLLIRIGGRC